MSLVAKRIVVSWKSLRFQNPQDPRCAGRGTESAVTASERPDFPICSNSVKDIFVKTESCIEKEALVMTCMDACIRLHSFHTFLYAYVHSFIQSVNDPNKPSGTSKSGEIHHSQPILQPLHPQLTVLVVSLPFSRFSHSLPGPGSPGGSSTVSFSL